MLQQYGSFVINLSFLTLPFFSTMTYVFIYNSLHCREIPNIWKASKISQPIFFRHTKRNKKPY